MITPSSNTCVEPITVAMLRHLDVDVTAHFTRVRVTRIALDGEDHAQFGHERMLTAARLLADSAVDVIAWSGTSGSWMGLDADRELCREIEEETGIPATTSTLAITEALHGYAANPFGLAVPYLREVAERIVTTYKAHGLDCGNERHLGISVNAEFSRLTDSEIENLVSSAAPGSEAVAVVCTNVAAAPLVQGLEQTLGLPIIDSISATVWKTVDLVAPGWYLSGWGDLLQTGSLRVRLQPLVERLLEATLASRTTVRVDLPERALHVDRVVAEAVRSGIKSIRHDSSLDQWAMPTVKWIGQHRTLLVQNDFASDGPAVSPELRRVYGVEAQMLGPIIRHGRLVGWISIHQVGHKRVWSSKDRAVLQAACREAEQILQAHAPAAAERLPTDA